jgi:hypothetical protein
MFLYPTIGLNKGDNVRFNLEHYGYGYGSTFSLPQSFKYTSQTPRTFYQTYTVQVANSNPEIDWMTLTVDIEMRLRAISDYWDKVTLELYENNVLVATTSMTRTASTPYTAVSAPLKYSCHVDRNYDMKLYYDASATATGPNPVWVLFDWPDDDHSGMPNWDPTSTELADHDHYWREHYNVAQGGMNQVRNQPVIPALFFWNHVLRFNAQATDPGSDDMNFKYYSSLTGFVPIRIVDFYNNGLTPEPVAPPTWTQFSGTAPFTRMDSWTMSYTNSQTITLVVTDDDGGTDVDWFVIT